uniref:Uncharacterized protein n=1 Tax=Amphimedon queenslandica TaxID=400682 RepID=A0A1X7VKN4_AMPQE
MDEVRLLMEGELVDAISTEVAVAVELLDAISIEVAVAVKLVDAISIEVAVAVELVDAISIEVAVAVELVDAISIEVAVAVELVDAISIEVAVVVLSVAVMEEVIKVSEVGTISVVGEMTATDESTILMILAVEEISMSLLITVVGLVISITVEVKPIIPKSVVLFVTLRLSIVPLTTEVIVEKATRTVDVRDSDDGNTLYTTDCVLAWKLEGKLLVPMLLPVSTMLDPLPIPPPLTGSSKHMAYAAEHGRH